MTLMNLCARYLTVSSLLISLVSISLASTAEIGCIYPAGGAPGTTFEISVRGQGLCRASGALISGSGVEAALLDVVPPSQAMSGKRLTLPQLQDEVRLRVTIAPDAEPGPRDFRLVCSNDFTVPLAFHIGRYAEVTEQPDKVELKASNLPNLPVCINGRIAEKDTDSFRFNATKGQTLVAQVQGRSLNPYLSNTVPGWFQPVLTLFDSQGNEVANADDFRFDSDQILVILVPATGEYVLQLRDATCRTRDDFVYRLTLGELPLVTGFFPMGGRKGDPLNVTLEGVNLPPQKVRIFSGSKTSEACLHALMDGKLYFPGLRFDLDTLPERTEIEPAGGDHTPQNVDVPVIVNGTIGKPGDSNVFRFEGKAGQNIAIEAKAKQLGSPLDTLITLADSRGNILAMQNGQTNVFTDRLTEHGDSSITRSLPADGVYEVRLSDNRNRGGADYHYRLRISEPRPNFELWVTPSTLCIPLGGTVRANVHVRRVDGFTGPISLQLDNPPLGINCIGGQIPTNATESVITLTTTSPPKRLPPAPFELTLSGIVTNGTTSLRQIAVPAHRNLLSKQYDHLVPDRLWMAEVPAEKSGLEFQIRLPEQAMHISATETKPFSVTIASGKAKALASYVTVRVVEPENGFLVTDIRNSANVGDWVVTLACAKAEHMPPKTGNLVLSVGRKSPKYKLGKHTLPDILTAATPYVIE